MNEVAAQARTRSQAVIDRRDRYMSINYGRYPVAIERGEGCNLYDFEGKRYLDLFAGFGAGLLGHCHPDLVRAVTEQASNLWHPGNLFHSEPQTRAAEAISKHGFAGRSFFCHSGADANEAAFKLARLYGKVRPGKADTEKGGRYKIIATDDSFHGRSFGAMAATGQPKVSAGYEPLPTGFGHVPFNDVAAMDNAVDDETVAIIVEPIQGEGGVKVPADDYLPSLRRLCDAHDMLLICDEVWTGCGRTGRYFAYQHWMGGSTSSTSGGGGEPDIMTLAKGVGGGLPVAVMCAKPHVAELFDWQKHGGVAHATTLGGNCLSMAAAAAVFDVLERDRLVERAAELGDHAVRRLRDLAGRCDKIKEVRGKGLFIGVELTEPGRPIVDKCLQRNIMINVTQDTVLRLAPPLVISRQQLDEGLDTLEEIIAS